jgi:hypothetical protein
MLAVVADEAAREDLAASLVERPDEAKMKDAA